MYTVWDWLTFLWSSAMGFLDTRIQVMGLDFTLWQFGLGSVLFLLFCYAVASVTE